MGAAIAQGFSFLLAKLVAVVKWFGDLFVAVFVSVWDMLKDLLCWGLESALEIVTLALGAFDFSALSQYANTWAQLPAGVLEVLGAVGLTQAFGIVVSAIGIRLLLQLIPFTRLGS